MATPSTITAGTIAVRKMVLQIARKASAPAFWMRFMLEMYGAGSMTFREIGYVASHPEVS